MTRRVAIIGAGIAGFSAAWSFTLAARAGAFMTMLPAAVRDEFKPLAATLSKWALFGTHRGIRTCAN